MSRRPILSPPRSQARPTHVRSALLRTALVPAVAALLLAGQPVGAGEAATPAALLRRLYAAYPLSSGRGSPVMDRPGDWLAPPLLDLMRRDRARAAAAHEVGVVDGDPVCSCQDDAGLHGVTVSVERQDADTASATVRFTVANTAATVRYRLVRAPGGWRIADIGTPEVPSLRGHLEKNLPK